VSRRTKRVAQLLRHELGKIVLSDLHDPRIGFVTITRVEVSPDLRAARVFVSVLGDPSMERTALRGLRSARRRIQCALGERIALRRTPELSFQADDAVKKSVHVSSLLSELAREREGAEPAPADQTEPDRPLAEESLGDASDPQ